MVAGPPTEATALGNVLVQAIGAGVVRDLEEARAVVRASCHPEVFAPGGLPLRSRLSCGSLNKRLGF